MFILRWAYQIFSFSYLHYTSPFTLYVHIYKHVRVCAYSLNMSIMEGFFFLRHISIMFALSRQKAEFLVTQFYCNMHLIFTLNFVTSLDLSFVFPHLSPSPPLPRRSLFPFSLFILAFTLFFQVLFSSVLFSLSLLFLWISFCFPHSHFSLPSNSPLPYPSPSL